MFHMIFVKIGSISKIVGFPRCISYRILLKDVYAVFRVTIHWLIYLEIKSIEIVYEFPVIIILHITHFFLPHFLTSFERVSSFLSFAKILFKFLDWRYDRISFLSLKFGLLFTFYSIFCLKVHRKEVVINCLS